MFIAPGNRSPKVSMTSHPFTTMGGTKVQPDQECIRAASRVLFTQNQQYVGNRKRKNGRPLSIEFDLFFHIYSTTEPFGKDSSTVASDNFPSGPSPDKIIPSDISPLNLTGFKLMTQITFLPTNSLAS